MYAMVKIVKVTNRLTDELCLILLSVWAGIPLWKTSLVMISIFTTSSVLKRLHYVTCWLTKQAYPLTTGFDWQYQDELTLHCEFAIMILWTGKRLYAVVTNKVFLLLYSELFCNCYWISVSKNTYMQCSKQWKPFSSVLQYYILKDISFQPLAFNLLAFKLLAVHLQ